MKIKNVVAYCLLACMFCCFPGCQDSDDVGENYTTFTGETISDFLQNNADYSDFAEALKTAGAFSLLESYGSYTCFVPNNTAMYNPQIQISAESETKRSIFREKDKTKRSKKESAQHSKSRNKSFVMTSVSAL